MGKCQRPPPKGRRGLMGLHAFAFQSGKEKLLAKTTPASHETLDCDSRKCDSRIRQNTGRASGTVTFRGPFSFAYLLLCLSLDIEAIALFVAKVSPSRQVLRLEFRHQRRKP